MIVLITLMTLSVVLSLTGALILTDAGQIFGISKKIVIGYFRVHKWIMGASAFLMIAAVVLQGQFQLLRPWQIMAFVVVVIGGIIATKYATPYVLFPSKQHTAVYRKVSELDGYLEAEDSVYVVEHRGEVRAFPRKLVWQAHIFGGEYGGEDIVFTYCVLTNLPIPYANDLDGQPMNLRVLAQTNNNLLLWDTKSGEIIQQITNACDISRRPLEPLPVVEMSWGAFQTLHPEGTVAYVEFSNPIERLMAAAKKLEEAYLGDRWLFNTVDSADDRLPSKEEIIGVADGDEAVAYTKDYLRRVGVESVSVGGKRIVLAHVPEHDVIVALDRVVDGEEITVTSVDYFGNTEEHGQLRRAFVYIGPMWAVWVHYYPETGLVK